MVGAEKYRLPAAGRERCRLPMKAVSPSRLGWIRRVLPFAAWCVLISSAWAQDSKTLRGGWYPWMPYQYDSNPEDNLEYLTGWDVELMRAVARRAGWKLAWSETAWEPNLQKLRVGELDFALAASRNPERETYAWFSEPYRSEVVSLFGRRDLAATWPDRPATEVLKGIRDRGGRIAVVRGYYYGPEVEALLAAPDAAAWVEKVSHEKNAVSLLLEGSVEGFLADRLTGFCLIWEAGLLARIAEFRRPVYEDHVHVMFSKASCGPDEVEAFNRALREVRGSSEYSRIAQEYLAPVLLSMTLHSPWFSLLDLLGTAAFAVSGVIIARRERYDIVGALVLAALPAVGGGILRDLITGRVPLGVLRSPSYLLVVLAVVAGGYLFCILRDRRAAQGNAAGRFRWLSGRGALEFCDAIGLAVFTVIGVMVAVEQRCQPLWLWGPVAAALTGAGGGVLRDILRAQADIPTLKGTIYPEIALLWGLVFSLFISWEATRLDPVEISYGTVLVILGALATRLLVVHCGLRSLFLGREGNRS